MPKTLPERIFFTIVMAAIMVYGMIVYNVALNTGGVTNATFCSLPPRVWAIRRAMWRCSRLHGRCLNKSRPFICTA